MQTTDTKTKAWLTREEAIARLECSVSAFLRLVEAGRIRARDFGHQRYWRLDIEREAVPPEIPAT